MNPDQAIASSGEGTPTRYRTGRGSDRVISTQTNSGPNHTAGLYRIRFLWAHVSRCGRVRTGSGSDRVKDSTAAETILFHESQVEPRTRSLPLPVLTAALRSGLPRNRDLSSDKCRVPTEQGRMSTEQDRMSTEQGPMFTEQARMFTEQGRMFTEQGHMFTEQGRMFTEQMPRVD